MAKLAAATTLGLALGGLTAGIVADKFGRRRTLQWTLSIVFVGSLAAALAPSTAVLTLSRFIAALGLGGETVLGYGMLTEFLPPRSRGRWLAWIGLCANIGMPLALLAGFVVLPHPDGWRWMLVLPAVLALPVLWLRRTLPESARWLEARGDVGAADAIVTAMERDLVDLPPIIAATVPHRPDPAARLLAGGGLARLVVAASTTIGVMSAVFGFVSWLPTFFVSEGRSVAASALFAGLISLGNPIGVLVALLLIERVERKWAYVGACVAIIAFGAAYVFARSDVAIVTLGFLVVTAIFAAGTIGLIAYVPELFATAVRMRGVGIAATIGRIAAMILPFVVVPVLTAAGQPGVLALILAIVAGQGVIVTWLGVRSNGRSLEAI